MKEFIFFKNKNIELFYSNYITLEPNPILELYRCKLFLNIQQIFITKMLKKLGKNIFSLKKNYIRTLKNILSSWIFVQCSKLKNMEVQLFPTHDLSFENIKTTLNDFLKITIKSQEKRTELIDDVLTYINLEKLFKERKKLFINYTNSTYYNTIKNKYKIIKQIVNITTNNKIIKYIKYTIKLPFIINEYKLSYIIDNILIPKDIWLKLKNNFNAQHLNLNDVIWCVLLRYKCLSSHNHQLAVSPIIMNKMNNDMDLAFECFASSINNTFTNYCSIFYDLEKWFGSLGSFFGIFPIKGTYGFNPPYEKIIIERGVNNILKALQIAKKNNNKLTFILTLPIWDKKGKTLMNNFSCNKNVIDYGEFSIINKIKSCIYFVGLKMVKKDQFSYLDYNNQYYKDKTIQNTYIILLSSKPKNETMEYINKYNYYFS